jgi:NAD(P)-dependent dehydrogenase (short-subunit alcohol dehydrogenase family)
MSQMFDLTGKVVLVTGAESGIGRAIALGCAQSGARIIAAGLIASGLEQTAALAAEYGADTFHMPCDVRDASQVDALFNAALQRFGHLDAAVANAGMIGGQTDLIEVSAADFRAMLETNLVGTFLTVQAAARVLIAQGKGGSIIAMGSSSVLRAAPRFASYAASKGGVHALMQAVAVELAPHRIRVNTLVPGTTATEATRALPGYLERVAATLPMREVVDADELGRYVAFVLSDACPHLTGSLLKLDSGRTIA